MNIHLTVLAYYVSFFIFTGKNLYFLFKHIKDYNKGKYIYDNKKHSQHHIAIGIFAIISSTSIFLKYLFLVGEYQELCMLLSIFIFWTFYLIIEHADDERRGRL